MTTISSFTRSVVVQATNSMLLGFLIFFLLHESRNEYEFFYDGIFKQISIYVICTGIFSTTFLLHAKEMLNFSTLYKPFFCFNLLVWSELKYLLTSKCLLEWNKINKNIFFCTNTKSIWSKLPSRVVLKILKSDWNVRLGLCQATWYNSKEVWCMPGIYDHTSS